MGIASGADLPISLTVVSHDAPDEKTSASLVSSTQIFWQIGILFPIFVLSYFPESMEFWERVLFLLFYWSFQSLRGFGGQSQKKFRMFHEEGAARQSALNLVSNQQKISLKEIF